MKIGLKCFSIVFFCIVFSCGKDKSSSITGAKLNVKEVKEVEIIHISGNETVIGKKCGQRISGNETKC